MGREKEGKKKSDKSMAAKNLKEKRAAKKAKRNEKNTPGKIVINNTN
jgi:hypothetical protein